MIMCMFICGYIRPNKYGDEKGKMKESMSALKLIIGFLCSSMALILK